MFKLNKEQSQALGLLSIGTFLEYFDLMLYVHMAVLLNGLFFPKTDPHSTALLSAFAFSITFVFRPFGALLFGYVGDHVGRKSTVIITSFLMSISCVIMANLPPYEQIGVAAAWLVTICRIIQGISSMGEITGAKLYLTETVKPPAQYAAVTLMSVCAAVGTLAALGIASLSTAYGFNWRIAFWIGAGVAVMGSVARTTLRETPEFADAKRRINKAIENATINKNEIQDQPFLYEKVNKRTAIAYFCIECGWPVCIYFTYIYCADILKYSFNYTPGQIIHHNLIVSIIDFLVLCGLTYIGYKVYPLKIVKIRLYIFSAFVLVCPYLLNNISSPLELFFIQVIITLFAPGSAPATPIFLKRFPILKRFTYISVLYAISRALTFPITSFGIVFLAEKFSNWGLLIIFIPIGVSAILSVMHFEGLANRDKKWHQNLF